MKIGEFVKRHIKQIFAHCDTEDHHEIELLLNPDYSKKIFGIHYPFCMEIKNIGLKNTKKSKSTKYWTEVSTVRGKQVRVSSQWYETSVPKFTDYLNLKGIAIEGEIQPIKQPRQSPSSRANSRFRGNPIGNAQNLVIRNILSSIGLETFSEEEWKSAKDYFSHKCAYCGSETELLMGHAIPINKEKLGEHRLENLVPSCKLCNTKSRKRLQRILKRQSERDKKNRRVYGQ